MHSVLPAPQSRPGKLPPIGRAQEQAEDSSKLVLPGQVPGNLVLHPPLPRVSTQSGSSRPSRSGSRRPSRPLQLHINAPHRTKKLQGVVQRLRARSRALINSWRFCVLTTVLTFFALFGDDFRLSSTHLATDNLFNIITIFCILVFSVEIIASSLGQDEYFLGFFFLLDFGATVTLVFDLTWVWNELACNSSADEGGSGALKTSRAGRAGARAARTVRIIRLIRLVKLYKTYKTAIEQKEGERSGGTTAPGSSDLMESEEGDPDEQPPAPWKANSFDGSQMSDKLTDSMDEEKEKQKDGKANAETRVGKKLSDKTTQRVIILVLVMLFVMPLFLPSAYGFDELRASGDMGAELIYERLRAWCFSMNTTDLGALPWCLQGLGTASNELTEERYLARLWYEEYLLMYIYYHHVGNFAWRLHWIGFNSTSLPQSGVDASAYLSQLARMNQQMWLGPRAVSEERLQDWDSKFGNPSWQEEVVALPETIRRKLVRPWLEKCSQFLGVAITTYNERQLPSVCSITEELRCSEIATYIPLTKTTVEDRHLTLMFAFDTRGTTQLEAALSMLQTIFICLAVGVGAMSFSKDANQLLLNPIERMIAKMEAIKDNPLEAIKLGDLEYGREERELARKKEELENKSKIWKWFCMSRHLRTVKEPMETVILEKTIIKLGGLLALGFGEAGAEIIGQNMRGGHSAGVNAMVSGSKVDAIIGFCNIRSFTHATEVLKEKVMVFVNQIGEIVHGCSDDYHGAPNKNIGDCFLIVWRLSGTPAARQTKLADMAIMSFIRIVAEINKSHVLARYREHPGLLQRLPKYRVEMGFGLHCGWAIEGAIGSEFKIDASYLSPNVNVAARLEAATEQFGVWILISHFMTTLCTKEMAAKCRLIDHVTVKGSRQPVRLYTLDLDYMRLEVKPQRFKKITKNRYKIRQIREVHKTAKWLDEYKVWEAFRTDEDLALMRSRYSAEFFQRFSMAYRNYEAGEWMVARDMFLTCHYSLNSVREGPANIDSDEVLIDGPTTTLLRFMQTSHYYPPNDWQGHRELTEK